MSLPKLFGCNPVDPFATCHTYSALLRRHQRGQRILGCDSCSLLHPWLPLKASTYYKQWPFRAESYNCCHHSSLCCYGQGKLKFLYFWSFQSFFRNILCVPLFSIAPFIFTSLILGLVTGLTLVNNCHPHCRVVTIGNLECTQHGVVFLASTITVQSWKKGNIWIQLLSPPHCTTRTQSNDVVLSS